MKIIVDAMGGERFDIIDFDGPGIDAHALGMDKCHQFRSDIGLVP